MFPSYQGYPGYQQPYPQQYQPYQPYRQSGLTGRVVKSPEEITPQEVPTDGTMAFFPASDGSCVYGKRWMPDGSISTSRFVPDGSEQRKPDRLEVMGQRMDELFSIVEDIRDNMPVQQRMTRKRADDE